jgi:hypothetical protein
MVQSAAVAYYAYLLLKHVHFTIASKGIGRHGARHGRHGQHHKDEQFGPPHHATFGRGQAETALRDAALIPMSRTGTARGGRPYRWVVAGGR